MIADRKSCQLTMGAFGALVALSFAAHYYLLVRSAAGEVGAFFLVGYSVVVGAVLFGVASLIMSRVARSRMALILKKALGSSRSQPPVDRSTRAKVVSFARLAEEVAQMVVDLDSTRKSLQQAEAKLNQQTTEKSAEANRITAQLRSEVEQCHNDQRGLRQAAELFGKTFAVSPVALATLTLREGCFVEINERFLQVLGYNRDEVVNHTDNELQIWEKVSLRDDLIRERDGASAPHEVECRLRTKSGELRNVVITSVRTEVQGTPCIVLTVVDTGERNQLDVQRFQAQKMDAIGQLAAGLAHDFNNILMIIQGYTSLLLTDTSHDPKTADALGRVSVAADRAAHLTRQLLTFSRKQVAHSKTLDLNDTIGGMGDVLKQLLGESIALRLDFASSTPQVEADPAMVQELVMNLALNARDALGKGGELNIATGDVTFAEADLENDPEARAGRFACLTIRDTGCGMDPAVLPRIFEPFFTTKEVGKGTGLGLATVYGIVRQHNGWIKVTSQLGQGTAFKIFFQASDKAAAKIVAAPRPQAVTTGKETVLVVEDEPGLRALVQGILQRYGYEILVAANGVDALQVWEQNAGRIDLLLTDMVMPEGMTGRELADKLRAKQPTLKVIYTSGYSVDVLSDGDCEFVEGVNFLQKPYRPQNLAETVRKSFVTPERTFLPAVATLT